MLEKHRSNSVWRRVSTVGASERTAPLSISARTIAAVVPLPDRKATETSVRRPPTPAASIPAATARYLTGGVNSMVLLALHRLRRQTQTLGLLISARRQITLTPVQNQYPLL
ncbi:hypothetical protein ABVK25_008438 [Lepraria finkii]|uniref:Uncharacterized protein n=1 Tax=Lepraria finkii TaxID=1340010 RepID=A0ABR4B0F3_9LECA